MKKDKKEKLMARKVIGKIEPEKLPGREPEQLEWLKWFFLGIVFILVTAACNAFAMKFFDFAGFF